MRISDNRDIGKRTGKNPMSRYSLLVLVILQSAAGCSDQPDAEAVGQSGTDTEADSESGTETESETPIPEGCFRLAVIPGKSNWSWYLSSLPDGSLYVTGMIQTPATFDPGGDNETTLVPTQYGTIAFLSRYEGDGGFGWVEEVVRSPEHTATGWATAAHPEAGIFSCGLFTGPAVFGPGQPGEYPFEEETGNYIPYLAKHTLDGGFQWARALASSNYSIATHAVALAGGATVVAVAASGFTTFGEGTPAEVTLFSSSWDVYLARFEPSGDLGWVKHTGGSCGGGFVASYAGHIATAPGGEIVLGGIYSGTSVFGKGEANEIELPGFQYHETMFVGWHDPDTGKLLRISSALPVEDGWSDLYQLAVHPSGDVSVLGHFRGSLVLGQGEDNETTIENTAPYTDDQFIARFSGDGTLQWARLVIPGETSSAWLAAPAGEDFVIYGSLGASGTVLMTGDTETLVVPADSGAVGYLARYRENGDFGGISYIAGSGSISTDGIAAVGDGSFWLSGMYQGQLECEGDPEAVEPGAGIFIMRIGFP
jgi:hypothetical protein